MKKNHSAPLFVSIAIAFLLLFVSSNSCMAQDDPRDLEQDYIKRASDLLVDKNYEQAARVLEELLAKQPDLNNETIYKQLTYIYDDYLFNFEEALSLYEKYLVRFPKGKFVDSFRERVAYLKDRRSEWQALRDFRKIMLEVDKDRILESLKEVEVILTTNENALIAPEMHRYLANSYFETKQYQKARKHMEEYVKSFDKTGISNADKALTLDLYSDILIRVHRFDMALKAQDQIKRLGNQEENGPIETKKISIKEQRTMWNGFRLSFFYFIAVMILLIPIKFWRHFAWHEFKQLVKPILLLALLLLGPVLFLNRIGGQEIKLTFFLYLWGLSVLSLVIIKLLAPLSLRVGRTAYISISLIHMAAASFMTYYLTVYTPMLIFFQR
ncbi:tetratricopeptide repeat protein [Cohnella lupini]|uniref:Outer membrane protein assembly factor BamD (BamD/ComL family) n=1 Tax=Cohnella lupini TaxID=1294267 RepID=A0A3D9I0L3_9BACL|nr:tetratricopeptide repeat protein [Cohnella lupini]RED55297.1 outer membrane protein assembly factor BamD (BamD/ComL family) [Cohnella lupini]